MATTRIYPHATHRRNNWAVVPSTSEPWAVLADLDLGTYVENTGLKPNELALEMEDTFVLPARGQVRGVRPLIVWAPTPAPPSDVFQRFALYQPNDAWFRWVDSRSNVTFNRTFYGPYLRKSWLTGREWSQVELNRMRLLVVRDHVLSGITHRVASAAMDIEWSPAPVVTVTEPLDEDGVAAGNQVLNTSTPWLGFDYTHAEGGPVERTYWAVFPESVYSQPGFYYAEPDPYDPIAKQQAYDLGAVWAEWVHGRDQRLRVGVPLSNGKYRAYIAAADGNRPHEIVRRYSAWGIRDFEMAVVGPPVPTLTAVPQ